MSRDEAEALAQFYNLKTGNYDFAGHNEVSAIWLSLRSVQRITKSGGSFDDIAQEVANRIGTMKVQSYYDRWVEKTYLLYWEYKTIDGVRAIIAEKEPHGNARNDGYGQLPRAINGSSTVSSGLTIFK